MHHAPSQQPKGSICSWKKVWLSCLVSIHICLADRFPTPTSPYSTYSRKPQPFRYLLQLASNAGLGGYDYKISYKVGHQHANADTLSRLQSNSMPPASPENIHVLETLNSSPVTSVHIRQWTAKDPALAKVRDSLIAGRRPQDDIAPP